MLGAHFDLVIVYPGKQIDYLRQRLVDRRVDDPQRVIGRHEIVQLLEGEQTFGECVGSVHSRCRFRSSRSYAGNASRYRGVDLVAE